MSEKPRNYVIFQVPGVKNGRKVDVNELAEFINGRDAIEYEFVAFLPAPSGVSKNVLFRRKTWEW